MSNPLNVSPLGKLTDCILKNCMTAGESFNIMLDYWGASAGFCLQNKSNINRPDEGMRVVCCRLMNYIKWHRTEYDGKEKVLEGWWTNLMNFEHHLLLTQTLRSTTHEARCCRPVSLNYSDTPNAHTNTDAKTHAHPHTHTHTQMYRLTYAHALLAVHRCKATSCAKVQLSMSSDMWYWAIIVFK